MYQLCNNKSMIQQRGNIFQIRNMQQMPLPVCISTALKHVLDGRQWTNQVTDILASYN